MMCFVFPFIIMMILMSGDRIKIALLHYKD